MKSWIAIASIIVVLTAAGAQAELFAEAVSYTHHDVKLKGYLVYDDALPGKRPGVLVVHEWWGLNDYARMRAERLASLGYTAFALDMYGEGKVTGHPDQASKWMKAVTQNEASWRNRAMAGLEILKAHEKVDATRLAAIGYCFGGSTVQQMAYGGADLRGVVSFHGSLIPPPRDGSDAITAHILICHGAADPFVTEDTFRKYLTAMEGSTLDWQMILYGGARHSFTNPGADKMGIEALKYDAKADHRSWDHMRLFLEEIFKAP